MPSTRNSRATSRNGHLSQTIQPAKCLCITNSRHFGHLSQWCKNTRQRKALNCLPSSGSERSETRFRSLVGSPDVRDTTDVSERQIALIIIIPAYPIDSKSLHGFSRSKHAPTRIRYSFAVGYGQKVLRPSEHVSDFYFA